MVNKLHDPEINCMPQSYIIWTITWMFMNTIGGHHGNIKHQENNEFIIVNILQLL
jgi:hypothetical protein